MLYSKRGLVQTLNGRRDGEKRWAPLHLRLKEEKGWKPVDWGKNEERSWKPQKGRKKEGIADTGRKTEGKGQKPPNGVKGREEHRTTVLV